MIKRLLITIIIACVMVSCSKTTISDSKTLFNPRTEQHEFSIKHVSTIHPVNECITSAAYNSSGTLLVLGTSEGTICLYDIFLNRTRFKVKPFTSKVRYSENERKDENTAVNWIIFNSDDSQINALGSDKTLRSIAVPTGKVVKTMNVDLKDYQFDYLDAGKKLFAMRINANSVQLWDIDTLEHIKTLIIDDKIQTVKLSSDDQNLVCYHGQRANCGLPGFGSIKFWSVDTGELKRTIIGADFIYLYSFDLSHDDSKLVTTGMHTRVTFWDLRTCLDSVSNYETCHSNAVVFNPSGKIVANLFDGSVTFIDSETGEVIKGLYENDEKEFLLFHPVQNSYLLTKNDGVIEIREFEEK
jgi:WD40 repeat protein